MSSVERFLLFCLLLGFWFVEWLSLCTDWTIVALVIPVLHHVERSLCLAELFVCRFSLRYIAIVYTWPLVLLLSLCRCSWNIFGGMWRGWMPTCFWNFWNWLARKHVPRLIPGHLDFGGIQTIFWEMWWLRLLRHLEFKMGDKTWLTFRNNYVRCPIEVK